MKAISFLALIFLASASFSQSINKQELTQKYWVENTELSTPEVLVFDAHTSFTKNTSVPYSLNAFKLENNFTGMFYDWGLCKSVTPPEMEKGNWVLKQNKLTINSSICQKELEIISVTDEKLSVIIKH